MEIIPKVENLYYKICIDSFLITIKVLEVKTDIFLNCIDWGLGIGRAGSTWDHSREEWGISHKLVGHFEILWDLGTWVFLNKCLVPIHLCDLKLWDIYMLTGTASQTYLIFSQPFYGFHVTRTNLINCTISRAKRVKKIIIIEVMAACGLPWLINFLRGKLKWKVL